MHLKCNQIPEFYLFIPNHSLKPPWSLIKTNTCFPMTDNRRSHFSPLSPLTKPRVAVSRQPHSPQLGMCLYFGNLRSSPTYWCDSSHFHRHYRDLHWWPDTYKASDPKAHPTYQKKPCPSLGATSFPALHTGHAHLNGSHFPLHKPDLSWPFPLIFVLSTKPYHSW